MCCGPIRGFGGQNREKESTVDVYDSSGGIRLQMLRMISKEDRICEGCLRTTALANSLSETPVSSGVCLHGTYAEALDS